MITHARCSSRNQPVVVAGLSLNGATVLRRLSRLGYEAWGLSYDRNEPGWHVARAQHCLTPHPEDDFEAWFEFMCDFAGRFHGAPPLLPMSDVHVISCDQAAARWEGRFRTHALGTGLHTALTSKRATFELAGQHGFPCPKTSFVKSRDELAVFIETVCAPVLIKPDLASPFKVPWFSSKLLMWLKIRKSSLFSGVDRDVVAQGF